MTTSGPPRPKGTPKDEPPVVDEETTAVQALPVARDGDWDVTIAEPPSDDLLATRELPVAEAAVEEPEDPNKAYFAPQVLPTPAVPDHADAQRIVLNLPDQSAVLPPSPQDVDRARRRAPTVKVPRGTLAARAGAPVEPVGALPPAPPPAPPKAMTTPSSPKSAQVDDPKPLLSLPSEPRAEAPPTALHVSAPPPPRPSRLPWIALAALGLGAGAFALLTLDKEDRREASGGQPATQATPGAPSPEPRPAAPPAEKPTAIPSPVAAAEPTPAASAIETAAPAPTPEPVAAQAPAAPARPLPVTSPAGPQPPPNYKPPASPPLPATTQKSPAKPPSSKDYTPPTI